MQNLVMMLSPKLDLGLGKNHIRHFHFTLVGQQVATIEQGQHVRILRMKEQVSIIELKLMT
jgi:hypothetical protein